MPTSFEPLVRALLKTTPDMLATVRRAGRLDRVDQLVPRPDGTAHTWSSQGLPWFAPVGDFGPHVGGITNAKCTADRVQARRTRDDSKLDYGRALMIEDRDHREPLVLLHGVTGSKTMWRHVEPLLSTRFETHAISALGHRGGTMAPGRVTIRDVVDDAERSLDRLGLDRPHLAGNSLGGWVALELARRNRARSVCALSPAGCWESAAGNHQYGARKLRSTVAMTRRTRWALPVLAHLAPVRRFALRDNAEAGQRVSAADLLTLADDLLACTVWDDLLSTSDELGPMSPLPCPVTLAWSERDRILPIGVYGRYARQLFPEATWAPIAHVGHVPMLDDPAAVAVAISAAAEAAGGNDSGARRS